MTRVDLTALPPKVRAVIYYAYAIAGLTFGSMQVGYSAAELGQPVWLKVALAVYAFLGVGLGLTAASNTPVDAQPGEAVVAHVQDDTEADALVYGHAVIGDTEHAAAVHPKGYEECTECPHWKHLHNDDGTCPCGAH